MPLNKSILDKEETLPKTFCRFLSLSATGSGSCSTVSNIPPGGKTNLSLRSLPVPRHHRPHYCIGLLRSYRLSLISMHRRDGGFVFLSSPPLTSQEILGSLPSSNGPTWAWASWPDSPTITGGRGGTEKKYQEIC